MKFRYVLTSVLTVLCLVAATFAGVVYHNSTDSTISAKELALRLQWVNKCHTAFPVVSMGGTVYHDTFEGRITCAVESYGSAKNFQDIEVMLDSITENAGKNDVARAACHDVVHNIGADAWKLFGERALIYNQGDCGMGYYHGLMSVALEGEIDKAKQVKILERFCVQYPVSENEDERGVKTYCVHGIGHAIGGHVEDLQEAYKLCNGVAVHDAYVAKMDCFGGALNQFAVVNRFNGSAENQMKFCDGFKERFLRECVRYMIYSSSATVEEITPMCNAMPEGQRREGCYSAVGMTASHKVLFGGGMQGFYLRDNPKEFAEYIEKICAGDTSPYCVRHTIAEVSEQILNPDIIMNTCNAFNRDFDKNTCTKIVDLLRKVQTL